MKWLNDSAAQYLIFLSKHINLEHRSIQIVKFQILFGEAGANKLEPRKWWQLKWKLKMHLFAPGIMQC